MFKKIIVGLLVSTVVVAAGTSIYNARADNVNTALPGEMQIEQPADRTVVLAEAAAVETAADANQGSQLTANQDAAQLTISQPQGFGSAVGSEYSGTQGGGRRFGQNTQASSTSAAYVGNVSGGILSGDQLQENGGQGTGNASGRPAWAGSNGRSQGAGGRGGRP